MSDDAPRGKPRQQPGSSDAGDAQRRAKEDRLAKALRANLAKRKRQVRGREDAGSGAGADATAGDGGKPEETGK